MRKRLIKRATVGSRCELITEAGRWCGGGIHERVRVYIYPYEFPNGRSTPQSGGVRRLESRTMATLPQLDDRVIAFQASFRLLVNFIQADQMWGSAAAFSIKEPYGVTQEVWKGWRAEKRREIRGPWVTGGRIMNSLKTKMAAQLIEPDTSLKPNLTVCILVVCVCGGTQFQARAWSSFLWYWVIRNWEGVEQQLNRITKMSGERWQW